MLMLNTVDAMVWAHDGLQIYFLYRLHEPHISFCRALKRARHDKISSDFLSGQQQRESIRFTYFHAIDAVIY